MTEKHPFGSFVPKNSKYLILGSFPAKNTDWYYGSGRNQFWKMLEKVYGIELNSKEKKKAFLKKQRITITDIILKCDRTKNSNSDSNLKIISLNFSLIKSIFKNNEIDKVFFTSRFVEKLFRRHFKDLIAKYPKIELITLPSPSPRYATMKFVDKVNTYKKLLPKKSQHALHMKCKFTIGVFGIILDKENRILLCHRRDYDLWNLPGGGLENNEAPWDGLIREVKEETGLEVEVMKLTGVYSKPEKNEIVLAFICNVIRGKITINEEADKIKYFKIDNLPKNTIPKQVERIKDAIKNSEATILRIQTGVSSVDLVKELRLKNKRYKKD
jgi:8-oxo-dGTP diphosphatase